MKKLLLALLIAFSVLTLASCDINDILSNIGIGNSVCQHRDADDNNKCDKCGVSYSDGTDISGAPECVHIFNTITVAATCENRGYYENECSICGIVIRGDIINALGHDMGEYVVDVAPTCTEDGTKIAYCKRNCGHSVTKVVSALGHIWKTTYSHNATYHWQDCSNCNATNTKYEHTTDNSGYCTVCDNPIGATEGVIYEISVDGTYAEVVGYIGTATKIVLADTYEGLPVKTIYKEAFKNSAITSVVIPDSVTSIGNYAFHWCASLTSVVIPDSVTEVGDEAFAYCTSLTSVVIPDSVISIGDSAFARCSKLQYNEYDNAYYLGNDHNPYIILVVVKNRGITSCTIHEDTKFIYSSAFYSCDSLTSVVIPDSVTSIGGSAFQDCTSLTSVVVGDSVTVVGDYAFAVCTSLTSVVIPDRVKTIGYNAFRHCSSLTSVVIGDSVTSIGSSAFSGCTNLTSILIGDSVTEVGDSAFYGCYKLVEIINKSSLNITTGTTANGRVGNYAIEVHTGDSKIVNKDGYLFYTYDGIHYLLGYIGSDTELVLPENYNGDSYEIYKYAFYNCDSLTSVVIDDSVTEIGSYAFKDCTSLTSVVIGDSVTSIGYEAFRYCDSLTSVVIPDSVTSIGDYAFSYCYSLTSVVIGDSVTKVGDAAFAGCTCLTSVVIPDSVTSIYDWAFYNCSGLRSIKYRGTEEQWNAITKGYNWNLGTRNYTITYNYDGE